MAEVLLFHHALGLTPAVRWFADRLRAAGHTVHTPDLFDGRTFGSLAEGVDHAEMVGFDELIARGVQVADGLPETLIYAGVSLGVLPAQKLAQTRPGARGAVLISSCVPTSVFGSWPDGVPVQIHGMDRDPNFVEEGDLDAARDLTTAVEEAELFLHHGSDHLLVEGMLPDHDAGAADLLVERVLAFLDART